MAEGESFAQKPAGLWLAREWAVRLRESLASLAGEPPRMEAGAAERAERLGEAVDTLAAQHGPLAWWEQSFNIWPEALFWIGAPEQGWSELGGRILEAAGIEERAPAETRGTFLELLSQSLDSLVQAMSAGAGREILCGPRRECPGPGAVREFRRISVAFGETELPPLVLALSAELSDASLAAKTGAERREAPREPARARPAGPEGPSVEARMLELLLDVELPVSISFGRTRLPLKDSLKLTTGSIVELNRGVGDPVDVIVNNCVIARGEVVVIEGNYGVRIRQIMSREALLRNLR